ncbi:hypothetical protein CONLIGDRAFT_151346 [Coniochaeta ligniaria NRRL 30616]|uniref:Uncharacterized protein n=1 Tax=Coniochaeta ligniaria NRRL 30616 TaxID=1408157 RepID=A0A1J7J578_9PEZI|nr:hypothetical protein CONLIGDRAFT_151346 [Coniochaeta ligniaria NRRL 30616]
MPHSETTPRSRLHVTLRGVTRMPHRDPGSRAYPDTLRCHTQMPHSDATLRDVLAPVSWHISLKVAGNSSRISHRRCSTFGAGSWIPGRGSRLMHRGSWIPGRGSRLMDRGSWPRVVDPASWTPRRGSHNSLSWILHPETNTDAHT